MAIDGDSGVVSGWWTVRNMCVILVIWTVLDHSVVADAREVPLKRYKRVELEEEPLRDIERDSAGNTREAERNTVTAAADIHKQLMELIAEEEKQEEEEEEFFEELFDDPKDKSSAADDSVSEPESEPVVETVVVEDPFADDDEMANKDNDDDDDDDDDDPYVDFWQDFLSSFSSNFFNGWMVSNQAGPNGQGGGGRPTFGDGVGVTRIDTSRYEDKNSKITVTVHDGDGNVIQQL